jgi:Mn2+/Fe2+ NRAMP family transporter
MLGRLLIPNTVCFAIVVFLAIGILHGDTRYLDWIVLVVIWLMISSTINAWDLMLQVADMKREKEQQG